MRRIVFDIETCAYPFESLAESQKEYLLRYADKEPDPEKRQMMVDDAVRYTSLYPYTSKCIVIGIYDVEKGNSFIYYENKSEKKKDDWKSESATGGGKVHYKGLSEKEMLESFWRVAKKVDQFITFNGRNFDVPFLMMRSAMLGVMHHTVASRLFDQELLGSHLEFASMLAATIPVRTLSFPRNRAVLAAVLKEIVMQVSS